MTGIAVLCSLAGAQAASATIVFKHDKQVWAMNDDGSDQRLLAAGGPLGMEAGLDAPHVAPNGATVVFEGSTNVNYHTCNAGVQYWGDHAAGVYRWRDGAVTRLSLPPARQPNCLSTFHSEPEATTAGRVLNVYWAYVDGTSLRGLQSGTQEGPSDADNPSACDNDIDLADPSPNPANAAQFAYLGCSSGGGQDAVAVSQGSTHTTPIIDDAAQRAVAWRSDGGRLVVSESGTEPGIWTYNPASPVDPVHVLGGDFGDVSFAGSGNERILFAAGGDIYSVPASCTAATCSFPGSATRLTSSGANDNPSWTAGGLRPPAANTGAGTGTGANPGTGAGTGAGGGGDSTVDLATLIQRTRAGRATSRGVPFTIALAGPATLEFTFFQVKGRKAKKLGTVRRAGKAGINRLTIKKAGRKKFKKGKYRAQIRAIVNRQKGPAKTVSFSVKR